VLWNESWRTRPANRANDVKWRKPVRPGDQLIIEIEMGRARGKIAKAKGVCKVVSEAEVMFSVVEG